MDNKKLTVLQKAKILGMFFKICIFDVLNIDNGSPLLVGISPILVGIVYHYTQMQNDLQNYFILNWMLDLPRS